MWLSWPSVEFSSAQDKKAAYKIYISISSPRSSLEPFRPDLLYFREYEHLWSYRRQHHPNSNNDLDDEQDYHSNVKSIALICAFNK